MDIGGFEKYTLRKYSLHHFNISAKIATQDQLKIFYGRNESPFFDRVKYKLFKKGKPIYKEKKRIFDPNFNSLQLPIYLDGYWQSEKYFNNCEKEIRKEFTIKSSLSEETKKLINLIKKCNSVSLHIRRGDYVTNKKTYKVHGVIDLNYYKKSISYLNSLQSDLKFFIFSDDVEWVRNNFSWLKNCTYVGHNNADNNYQDLNLMSYCKHHIIANSTFSWWGAWLSNNKNKIVITPKNWFNNLKSTETDLIPKDWVVL